MNRESELQFAGTCTQDSQPPGGLRAENPCFPPVHARVGVARIVLVNLRNIFSLLF